MTNQTDTFSDLSPEQLADAVAQGEAARERFLAAERARHNIPTYHSDRLGAVAIPEDDNGSHCCGAPVEAAKVNQSGRVTLWRCSQCGLPQDPR